MGPLLTQGGALWTRQMIEAYLGLVGEQGLAQLDGIDCGDGFEPARRRVHARFDIPPPAPLDFPECRLEWNGGKLDGAVSHRFHVATFEPESPEVRMPPPGTECRVRFDGGSHRVIVLGGDSRCLTIARAPHRCERRTFRRLDVGGLAVVRLGGTERPSEICDISEGGVCLKGTFVVEAGEHVDLLLRLEGKKGMPFECEGIVANCRRVRKNGQDELRAGIRFTRVPPELRTEIRRLAREEPGA